MYEKVYKQSFEAAAENGETDMFHKSDQLNRACAAAIDREIAACHYGENLYATNIAAGKVMEEYGAGRVSWVLVGILQYNKTDVRYSTANKKWAEVFDLPPGGTGAFVNAHPIVVNGFIDNARRMIAERERDTQQNKKCAQAIRKAIKENSVANVLYCGGSDSVVGEYGLVRVQNVLGNALQAYRGDPNLSEENAEWAASVAILDIDARDIQMNFSLNLLNHFIDDVRQTKAMLIPVANHIIEYGRNQTTSGNYFINYAEAGGDILPAEKVEFFKTALVELMHGSEAVSDVELTDEGEFDVNFYLAYTPNYEPWREEVEEYGADWPRQEPLEPLRPAESRGATRPSLLGQLQDSIKAAEQGAETGNTAPKRSTGREV